MWFLVAMIVLSGCGDNTEPVRVDAGISLEDSCGNLNHPLVCAMGLQCLPHHIKVPTSGGGTQCTTTAELFCGRVCDRQADCTPFGAVCVQLECGPSTCLFQ